MYKQLKELKKLSKKKKQKNEFNIFFINIVIKKNNNFLLNKNILLN